MKKLIIAIAFLCGLGIFLIGCNYMEEQNSTYNESIAPNVSDDLILDVSNASNEPYTSETSDEYSFDVSNTTSDITSENDQNTSALNPSGTIPEGAYYYIGVDRYKRNSNGFLELTKYKGIAGPGDNFPETASEGHMYIYGDYAYYYEDDIPEKRGWWAVSTIYDKKIEYGPILESINGVYIKGVFECFRGCEGLVTPPEIPEHVVTMERAFYGCTSLTSAPKIPNNVTDISRAFTNCTSLTAAPDIPNNIEDMYETFRGCSALSGKITINCDPILYDRCFDGTEETIELIGSCLDETKYRLANTATNNNVIYTLSEQYKTAEIPIGGSYYVGVTSNIIGDYTDATATFSEGDSFPIFVANGDVYVYGDYEYRYNHPGWSVAVLDTQKTEYGIILDDINNKPVTDMSHTFSECRALIIAPKIPSNIKSMDSTFSGCWSLTTAPEIPESVEVMSNTFRHCESLSGDIQIDANPLYYNECFESTEKLITIVGKCSEETKKHLASTSSTNNFVYNFFDHENSDPELNHYGIIPPGGTYYVGVTSDIVGKYTDATAVLGAGDAFPESVTYGDVYVYGDYEYRYDSNFLFSLSIGDVYEFSDQCGWTVAVLDKNKNAYAPVLNSINKKVIRNMNYTFSECKSLTSAPVIPQFVSYMINCFHGCISLGGEIVINANAIDVDECFYGTEKEIVIIGECSDDIKRALAYTTFNRNVSYQE